jgi:hypothetical protein
MHSTEPRQPSQPADLLRPVPEKNLKTLPMKPLEAELLQPLIESGQVPLL